MGKFTLLVISANILILKLLLGGPPECRQIVGDNTTHLVVVISDPKNFGKRVAIRETWGSPELLGRTNSELIFFMGHSKSRKIKIMTENEREIYKDVVIEDFIEDYYNLTLKVETAFRWGVSSAKKFKYFVKVDDDVLLNLEQLFSELGAKQKFLSIGEDDLFMFCDSFIESAPMRNPLSKWFVSYSDYPREIYPSYCKGYTYLLPRPAILRILEVCRNTNPLNFEDVFFTGICREKAGIELISFDSPCFPEFGLDLCQMDSFICQNNEIDGAKMREMFDNYSKHCK